MKIEEIQDKKFEIQNRIYEMLREFEADTSLHIKDIRVRTQDSINGTSRVVDVKLIVELM
jgi:hypothetical protein